MNLIKWNDFDSKLPSMFSAFDDVFGRDYFKSLASGMSMPAMNVEEHDDKFLLSLAVPGLEKDDCKVQVEGGVLTISSQKEQKNESKRDKIALWVSHLSLLPLDREGSISSRNNLLDCLWGLTYWGSRPSGGTR